MRSLVLLAALTLALLPQKTFAAADDLARVEGTIANIKHDIIYLKTDKGTLFKLKRQWIEKFRVNFRPGDYLSIEVNVDEALKLNGG